MRAKPCLLYDVSRLLARRAARTPTGIDRVDLRYAIHFLESDLYETALVQQQAGRFRLIDPQDGDGVIGALTQRWLNGGEERLAEETADHGDDQPSTPSRAMAGRLRATAARLRDTLAGTAVRGLDPGLVTLLQEKRAQEILYLNCSHHGVGSTPAYEGFKALAEVRIVFYLHDLIPLDFPQFVRKQGDRTHARRVSAMARHGDLVLVNSHYTRGRFAEFCQRNGLSAPQIRTLRIGVEDGFLAAAQRSPDEENAATAPLEGPYFVTLSTIEPRKNHLLLLRVWRRLVEARGGDSPKLVIVGRRGWNNREVFDILDGRQDLAGSIVELAGLDDARLVRLLRHARALLSPSLAEGWGMPVVEALTLGVPVVCSDIPAHRESAQGRALFIDPLDEAAWHDAVLCLAEDEGALEAARSRQAGFLPPSWPAHFRLLEAELADLARHSAAHAPAEHPV